MGHACAVVMPHEAHICGFGEHVSCIREEHHEGDHLSENAQGRFFIWAFDEAYCGNREECACLADADESPIECFNYREISQKEAREMLQKSPTET